MDRTVIVRGIVANRDRILVLQTSEQEECDEERFRWELPGGTVDRGQDLRDAIRREVREETGLDIEVLEQRERVLVQRSDEELDCRYFLLSAETRQVRLSEEHQDFAWIRPGTFREREWHYYAGYAIPVLERLDLPLETG